MKAYFYIKDLFDIGLSGTTDEFVVVPTTYTVGVVDQFTLDYHAEINFNYFNPLSFWEYSDCTDNGTLIDACELGGLKDSWNPFIPNLAGQYDNIVNGQSRGSFLISDSGNTYGIEGLGLGFDNLQVPINDIPSGGSSGAYSKGAFFLNFDETQDLLFGLSIYRKTSGGTLVSQFSHRYVWDVSTCSFSYTIVDLIGGDPDIDGTPFAFLTGGSAGWVDFGCGSSGGDLGDDPIVTQSIGFIATNNQQAQPVVGDVGECCYQSPALASTTDSDEFKNDIKGFIFKRNFSSESIDLILEKNGGAINGGVDIPLINNDYGTYNNFGAYSDYPNYKGYDLEWQKVLILEGPGTYQLRIDSTLITGAQTDYSIVFKLEEYTQEKAKGTFFIKSIMNGYLENVDFDFTGLNFTDGLRIRGFFGNRQPEYEQENIIYTNRESVQVRSELINTYTCQTMLIPSCITQQIIEFYNFADVLYLTDYNYNNHVKTYNQKSVVFDSIESIEYSSLTTLAPLVLKYKDFVQNFRKLNC